MNNTIESEVQEYIDFSLRKLSDPEFFDAVIEKIKDRFMEFYQTTDRETLLLDMRAKAIKGAREHGKLPATYEAIEEELRQEYIDIVMYSMMHLFQFEKQLQALGKEPPPVPLDSNARIDEDPVVRIVSVPSETAKDKLYFVKVDSITGFAFECLCPAFMFRNPQKVPCKHMRKLNEGSSHTPGSTEPIKASR
jgi:hypothetical protein